MRSSCLAIPYDRQDEQKDGEFATTAAKSLGKAVSVYFRRRVLSHARYKNSCGQFEILDVPECYESQNVHTEHVLEREPTEPKRLLRHCQEPALMKISWRSGKGMDTLNPKGKTR
mgnify:FL=1